MLPHGRARSPAALGGTEANVRMSAPQERARGGNGRRASAANPAPVLSISPDAKASLRILVVDGERSLRESCASVLEQEGYNVTACRRSEEAVELLKQHRFDIVLVELYMTPVSGLDLLKAALKANRNSLVIEIGRASCREREDYNIVAEHWKDHNADTYGG